ncbi:MAG: alcohol dehydrogenase catalytic domain-containing protein [Gemmatimonadota bacterium]
MKAAVLTQYRSDLEIRHLPDPEPGPTDAVVEVEACGVCRSDWHFWQEDWTWLQLGLELPRVPGHEFGGTVLEVGSEVQGVKPGDKVSATFHLACGDCDYCNSGRGNLCYAYGFIGFHHDGGYGQRVRVPMADFNLVKLPEEVNAPTAAALGCRYMTAYHGLVDQAAIQPGEWVAVYGIGGLGMAAVQIASALGAQVVAVSRTREKLEGALAEGAHSTVQANGNTAEAVKEATGGGAHVTVDCLGTSATLLPAVLSLRKGGRHLHLGLTGKEDQGMVSLPVDAMVLQELRFLGSVGCPKTSYPGLLSMVADETLKPNRLVERTAAVEEVNDILSSMSDFGTVGMHVITEW